MPVDAYDWEAFEASLVPPPPTRRRTRRGPGAAVLAAALWAIDDVVLGERRREPVVEEADDPGLDPDQRVIVHLVPGEPRRSYVLVRDAGRDLEHAVSPRMSVTPPA